MQKPPIFSQLSLRHVAPILFVLLWSTGFIGAKYALPFAEPFTLLFYRFLASLIVLIPIIPLLSLKWPEKHQWFGLLITGLLIHGGYLSGVFYAIDTGMSPALCALLVGLQPLLTTAVTPWIFGRAVSRLNWMGILLGAIGITIILLPSIDDVSQSPDAWIAACIALLSITSGAIYQNKYCAKAPLVSGAAVQYMSAVVLFGFGAWYFETGAIQITHQFLFAMAWLILGLSIGAILLLMYLIKRNESHQVASLFYLVPAITTIEAYYLFNDQLSAAQIFGMLLTTIAVYLATKKMKNHA